MSRSGYCDDLESEQFAMWRGQVASAIRGRRGQKFLVDLLTALDAMPVKELIADELERDGEVCAIGALGRARGIDMSKIDPEDPDKVAEVFNIAHQLAQEVVYVNDEWPGNYATPSQRWANVRKWVAAQIRTAPEVAA